MKQYLFVYFLVLASVTQAQQKIEVYFPFNKADITSETACVLDSTIHINSRRNIDSIKIYGYCDAIGSFSINDSLGIKRAAGVKSYLLERKTGDDNFIEMESFGKRVPVNDNSTDSLQALNRRVDVFIFSSQPPVKSGIASGIQAAKVGEVLRLNNLNFYPGRHILLPVSIPILDDLAVALKNNATIEIEIRGYICCMPVGMDGEDVDGYTRNLSLTRAYTVFKYLLDKGIDAKRMTYIGYGSHPIVREFSEADKATNRRVEVKIMKR